MTNLDQEIYFVKCDFGAGGQEAMIDYQRCSKSDVMKDLIDGQYADVLGVFYMNISEGHCRDVTEDFARECFDAELNTRETAEDFSEFVQQHHEDYGLEFDLAVDSRDPNAEHRLTAAQLGVAAE